MGSLPSVWCLIPTRGGKKAVARTQSEPELQSDAFTSAHLVVVVIDENEIGRVWLGEGGPWGNRGNAAGMDDGVGVSGHRGQKVGILILAPLILYPPLNASRALRTGSGGLPSGSGLHGDARKRKPRGFVERGWFWAGLQDACQSIPPWDNGE